MTPGVFVLTVDLIGGCSDPPLTARALNSLACPDMVHNEEEGDDDEGSGGSGRDQRHRNVWSEYVIARNGRMVASPCHLVAAAHREGFVIVEARRVDSAPVLGVTDEISSSSSGGGGGMAAADAEDGDEEGEVGGAAGGHGTASTRSWISSYIVALQLRRA